MTAGMIKIGLPAGSAFAGEEWDDGNQSEIAQIFIWHGGDKLHAIQTQYLENGTLTMSQLHGTTADAANFTVVEFDIGKEYITGIHSNHSQGSVISLTISTNLGNKGTFGRPPAQDRICKCSYLAYPHDPTHPGCGSASNGPAYVRQYIPKKEFKVDLGRYGGGQFRGFCGTTNNRSGLTSIGICFKVATTINDLKPRLNT